MTIQFAICYSYSRSIGTKLLFSSCFWDIEPQRHVNQRQTKQPTNICNQQALLDDNSSWAVADVTVGCHVSVWLVTSNKLCCAELPVGVSGSQPVDNEAIACNWLQSHYECQPGSVTTVSKMELYKRYVSSCSVCGLQQIVNPTTFATCIRYSCLISLLVVSCTTSKWPF